MQPTPKALARVVLVQRFPHTALVIAVIADEASAIRRRVADLASKAERRIQPTPRSQAAPKEFAGRDRSDVRCAV